MRLYVYMVSRNIWYKQYTVAAWQTITFTNYFSVFERLTTDWMRSAGNHPLVCECSFWCQVLHSAFWVFEALVFDGSISFEFVKLGWCSRNTFKKQNFVTPHDVVESCTMLKLDAGKSFLSTVYAVFRSDPFKVKILSYYCFLGNIRRPKHLSVFSDLS